MELATTCMLLIVPFMCVVMSVTDIGDGAICDVGTGLICMLLEGSCATKVEMAPAANTATFMDKRAARFIRPPISRLQSTAGIVC
jgi:hypothetical protein